MSVMFSGNSDTIIKGLLMGFGIIISLILVAIGLICLCCNPCSTKERRMKQAKEARMKAAKAAKKLHMMGVFAKRPITDIEPPAFVKRQKPALRDAANAVQTKRTFSSQPRALNPPRGQALPPISHPKAPRESRDHFKPDPREIRDFEEDYPEDERVPQREEKAKKKPKKPRGRMIPKNPKTQSEIAMEEEEEQRRRPPMETPPESPRKSRGRRNQRNRKEDIEAQRQDDSDDSSGIAAGPSYNDNYD